MVEAMIWILRTGAPWRELPVAYGPWQSVYTRFSRWSKSGVLQRLLHGLSQERDGEGVLIDATIALFDALQVMELVDSEPHTRGKALLVRVVSMLSKMC